MLHRWPTVKHCLTVGAILKLTTVFNCQQYRLARMTTMWQMTCRVTVFPLSSQRYPERIPGQHPSPCNISDSCSTHSSTGDLYGYLSNTKERSEILNLRTELFRALWTHQCSNIQKFQPHISLMCHALTNVRKCRFSCSVTCGITTHVHYITLDWI